MIRRIKIKRLKKVIDESTRPILKGWIIVKPCGSFWYHLIRLRFSCAYRSIVGWKMRTWDFAKFSSLGTEVHAEFIFCKHDDHRMVEVADGHECGYCNYWEPHTI